MVDEGNAGPALSRDELPALRVVHLVGGVRAIDFGEPKVRVQVADDVPILGFPRPPYHQLLPALRQLSLSPVGVDYLTQDEQLRGIQPPDWQVWNPASGPSLMRNDQAWSGVRHVPNQKISEIVDIAGRFTTYHRLLNIRVRHLSNAYNATLRASMFNFDGEREKNLKRHLFSSRFLIEIEAAIHAFLADAAGLRDLIAEATWRLVLKEHSADVTTLSTFLKKAKSSQHPLAQEIVAAGQKGGWLKNLSDLRNAVTHVAPVANTHELHTAELRLMALQGLTVPYLHYPLTAAGGELRERPARVNFDESEDSIRARLEEYRAFVESSGDALRYAWDTTHRLVDLAAKVRGAAGLLSQMLAITDKDIIGPVQVRGGSSEAPVQV